MPADIRLAGGSERAEGAAMERFQRGDNLHPVGRHPFAVFARQLQRRFICLGATVARKTRASRK